MLWRKPYLWDLQSNLCPNAFLRRQEFWRLPVCRTRYSSIPYRIEFLRSIKVSRKTPLTAECLSRAFAYDWSTGNRLVETVSYRGRLDLLDKKFYELVVYAVLHVEPGPRGTIFS